MRKTTNGSRAGFTLMEIVLVLGIMVAAAAMAIPFYHGTLKRERVRKAAGAIAADWNRTRATAIEKGETQLWMCMLADGTFSSSRYISSGGATNAEVTSMVAQNTGLSPNSAVSGDGSFGQSLPTGVSIGEFMVSEADTIVTMKLVSNSGQSGSATLLFYPDGTCSSARITVKGEGGTTMAVVINGMAGTVRTMRVESN